MNKTVVKLYLMYSRTTVLFMEIRPADFFLTYSLFTLRYSLNIYGFSAFSTSFSISRTISLGDILSA